MLPELPSEICPLLEMLRLFRVSLGAGVVCTIGGRGDGIVGGDSLKTSGCVG